MSGTFNDIDVPPTLVSFAVDIAKEKDIITPELKAVGDQLVLFTIKKDEFDLPDYAQVMKLYDTIHALIQAGVIVSAYALDGKGLAAAVSKMAFGNKLGVTVNEDVSKETLFAPGFGNIVAEVPAEKVAEVKAAFDAAGLAGYEALVGWVNEEESFIYGDMRISMEEALHAWTATLEKVFPTRATENKDEVKTGLYKADSIYVCKNKVAKPTVFIPVFPGTNCEYDSADAFERAGANTIVKDYTIQGWAMDSDRLKNGGSVLTKEYFDHLLEQIREIRMSERKFYQKITDIYATALDYDKSAKTTRLFFSEVQNKLHWAIHRHTAAELIVERANAEKPHMGLTSWEQYPNGKIQKYDVSIAKNYLSREELQALERIVTMYLDYAEYQAGRHIPMTMQDWSQRLNRFLEFNEHEILHDTGRVTHEIAKAFAESEFEKYRIVQDRMFESDFDHFLALEEQAERKND